jgi:putative hydrolase of the HAD superfamily
MILAFDLDDTLYDERAYVESGLRAVAAWGRAHLGLPAAPSFRAMRATLDTEGRGRIFDAWLASHGRASRSLVRTCVEVYRHHAPAIALDPKIRALLGRLAIHHPLYLVTDGHKVVQANKVAALGLAPLFRRVFITHRFGIRHAKPSAHCFELIRRAERCDWTDLAYVGDNPAKDFVTLNRLGATTIRVLTGVHRDVVARRGFDARHRIATLTALPALIAQLAGER